MEHRVKYLLVGILLAASSMAFAGQKAAPATAGSTAFDRMVDRVIAREAENNKTLRTYSPLVETYLQSMKADPDTGHGAGQRSVLPDSRRLRQDPGRHQLPCSSPASSPASCTASPRNSGPSSSASGFNWMMTMDMRGLDRAHYSFDYQGREFLGDVRCIVIDVTPKPHAGEGRFLGRVWVEDQRLQHRPLQRHLRLFHARPLPALRHLAAEHGPWRLAARLHLQRGSGTGPCQDPHRQLQGRDPDLGLQRGQRPC